MSSSHSSKTVTIRKRSRPAQSAPAESVPPITGIAKAKKEKVPKGTESMTRTAHAAPDRRDDDIAPDYDVGYGKPPLASRFTSENQPKGRGRKRKPTSIREVELKLLNARYRQIEKGRVVTLNGYEMLGRARLKLALNGNLRAMKEVILNTLPTPEELDEIEQGRPLTPQEVDAWRKMIAIARGQGGDNDD
ncbi:MAG: hypothetical protein R3E04_03925 [Sphingobium sp.]